MGPLEHSKAAAGSTESKQFHCPIDNCIYNSGSERHFKSKRLLNQHYLKVHADKKYACTKCSKGFASEWQQKYHEKVCGSVLSCTCGQKYNSRESLFTHCRRTGHYLPSDFPLKNSRKSYHMTLPPALRPVVVLIQQHFSQDAKRDTHAESVASIPNVTAPRRILPKEAFPNVGTLVNHTFPLPDKLSAIKVSMSTQTDGKCNCEDTTIKNGSSLNNTVEVTCPITTNTSTSTDNHKKERAPRRKNAAGTQTCKRCIIKRAMESAKLQVQQESRGSQCSPRIKCHYRSRKPSVIRENIETQTTESVVGRMKKPVKQKVGGRVRENIETQTTESVVGRMKRPVKQKVGGRVRENIETQTVESVAWRIKKPVKQKVGGRVRRNLASLVDQELVKEQDVQAAQTAWSSLDVILGSQWMPRCSSGTQTSPRSSYYRETCDSQTLTDDILFVNSVCEMNVTESRASGLLTKVDERLERDLSGNTSQERATSPLGIPRTDEPVSTADNSYSMFSYPALSHMETQTCEELGLDFLTDMDTHNYEDAPALSHMETQTCEELGFDFLTNMETQTTNDLFNDLELSDIQTQTPWTDLLDFCDTLDSSQFSAEIQTDITSQDLSELGEKDIADLIDMQTQTCSSTTNADLTNAYTQTLGLHSYFAPY